MVKKFLAIAAMSGALLVSACNTIHGAANDVKSTTDCADGVKNNC